MSQFAYPDSLIAYWKGNLGYSGLYVKNEVWPHNYPLLRVGNPSGTFSSQISGLPSAQWLLTNCTGVNNDPTNISGNTMMYCDSSFISGMAIKQGSINFIFQYNSGNPNPNGESLFQFRTGGAVTSWGVSLKPSSNALFFIGPIGNFTSASNILFVNNQYKITYKWDYNLLPMDTTRYSASLNNVQLSSWSGVDISTNRFQLGFPIGGTIGQWISSSYIGPIVLSSDPNFNTTSIGWPL